MRDTAEFDVTDFEDQNNNKGVYCRFYMLPKKDEAKSLSEGRPIFKDVEYVEIICAGNETNIVRRPVSDMDRRRFSKQYEMFRQGHTVQLIGTPLVEVPWITRSQVEELAYIRVLTLEQLSEVNDAVCTRIPGLFELKRRAIASVEKAASSAPFEELRRENEEMRKQNAEMQKQLAALTSRLNAALEEDES